MSERDLNDWYDKNKNPANAEFLKNKGCLFYIQYDKFMFKKKLVDIVHNVCIQPEYILLESLT